MAFLQRTYCKRNKKSSCPGQQHPEAPTSDGKPRDLGSAEETGVLGPRAACRPESGKSAAVGGSGEDSSWPRGRIQHGGSSSVRHRLRTSSGPAPVLMVPNNHLAVQLLLLLFECILHLLPLQATIPVRERLRVTAKKAFHPPSHHRQMLPAAQTQEKPARNRGPPRLSCQGEPRGQPWAPGTHPSYLKTLTSALGQNSLLVFKVLCDGLDLPRSLKFFLQHLSSPYKRQRRYAGIMKSEPSFKKY